MAAAISKRGLLIAAHLCSGIHYHEVFRVWRLKHNALHPHPINSLNAVCLLTTLCSLAHENCSGIQYHEVFGVWRLKHNTPPTPNQLSSSKSCLLTTHLLMKIAVASNTTRCLECGALNTTLHPHPVKEELLLKMVAVAATQKQGLLSSHCVCQICSRPSTPVTQRTRLRRCWCVCVCVSIEPGFVRLNRPLSSRLPCPYTCVTHSHAHKMRTPNHRC